MSEGRRSIWHDLVERKIGRRSLLAGALAAASTAAVPLNLRSVEAAAAEQAAGTGIGLAPAQQAGARLPFTPIKPTTEDALIVPPGYRWDMLAKWGDDMGEGMKFGFNSDFTAFFPIDLLEKGFDLTAIHRGFLHGAASSTDGLLAVNHEYLNPMLVSNYTGTGPKTKEQLAAEQDALGMSILRVRRGADGRWSFDKSDTAHNRRLTARTVMRMTGPAAMLDGGPMAIGTMGNCSGGMTPWGTVLTCEENIEEYGLAPTVPFGMGWEPEIYLKRHYGWVVEIDPFDKSSMPRKHTAMGRFRHENVAIRLGKDGTVVAYMGDDKADSCVYKFVADAKLTNPADRYGNFNILESGKLYAADFGNGRWILLDHAQQEVLRKPDSSGKVPFASQAEVLADARAAALLLRATPVDRPEDLEVNPIDGSVFISLTNNTGHGNFHGQIVRLVETNNDPAATTFDWSIFAVGGPQSGFSSPDNLAFDGAGNLWMVTDISTSRIAKGIYKFHGNNGMFFFYTTGPSAGMAYQFASGPNEAELTGPWWTPDSTTMFLSVQHPGEESPSLDKLTSHWPEGGSAIPRSATVAITGFPRGRR
jgi:secreted PhoX family phosphatase